VHLNSKSINLQQFKHTIIRLNEPGDLQIGLNSQAG